MERIQLRFRTPKYRFDLKAAILKSGFRTQKEFAKALDISTGVMSQVVSGRIVPNFEIQAKIAEVLNLSPKQLYRLLK